MKTYPVEPFDNVFLLKPNIFKDERGCFFESYQKECLNEVLGCTLDFVQDNHSISHRGVARGLHYQWDNPMGKLVRVVAGHAIDIVVDIRKQSETFGKYQLINLSEVNKVQVWIPPGFAHGFLALKDDTHLLYKCTSYYNKDGEASINLFDEEIGAPWDIFCKKTEMILSERDINAQSLSNYMKDFKF